MSLTMYRVTPYDSKICKYKAERGLGGISFRYMGHNQTVEPLQSEDHVWFDTYKQAKTYLIREFKSKIDYLDEEMEKYSQLLKEVMGEDECV